MPSSNSDAAQRIAALKRREASSGPRWFGVPLEDMQTASDMGFTVPLFLRALRQALYAQDVFETPGCFQHTHRCNQTAKNALRERLAGGEDPFVVCKPSVPVELLTSLLIDWLHELPGGLWGEELASGWPLIACTSPSRRKRAPGKGRTNLMQLMAKTLGGTGDTSTDMVTRVGPLLHALEPRRREVRVAPFAQATPAPLLLPTSHIHLEQVLLWLLAMLDLAVEYKEHSGMGYTEFAAVSAHTAPGSSAHIEHAPLRLFHPGLRAVLGSRARHGPLQGKTSLPEVLCTCAHAASPSASSQAAWHDSMTWGCVFSFRRSNEESTRRSSSSVHEHYWPTTRPTTKQRRRSQTYQKRANAGYLRILSPLRRVPSRCITSKTTSTPSRRVGRSAPLCARQPRRV